MRQQQEQMQQQMQQQQGQNQQLLQQQNQIMLQQQQQMLSKSSHGLGSGVRPRRSCFCIFFSCLVAIKAVVPKQAHNVNMLNSANDNSLQSGAVAVGFAQLVHSFAP